MSAAYKETTMMQAYVDSLENENERLKQEIAMLEVKTFKQEEEIQQLEALLNKCKVEEQ